MSWHLPWWPPPSRKRGDEVLDVLVWVARCALAAGALVAAVLIIVALALGWIS